VGIWGRGRCRPILGGVPSETSDSDVRNVVTQIRGLRQYWPHPRRARWARSRHRVPGPASIAPVDAVASKGWAISHGKCDYELTMEGDQ
jgi:hypothetical protein